MPRHLSTDPGVTCQSQSCCVSSLSTQKHFTDLCSSLPLTEHKEQSCPNESRVYLHLAFIPFLIKDAQAEKNQ